VRRFLYGGFGVMLLASLAAQVASCNAAPADTVYGNPNTLDRKNLPGEAGAEPLSCGGGGDGGGGGKKYDGGACPSFENDIFPYFKATTGKWRCTDVTCHGGTQAPKIDGTSAATCFASLQQVTVAGKAYIPSADSGPTNDPAATTILCNLQGACGTRMPEAPGQDPTADDLCMLQAWLSCGAPGPSTTAPPAKN
jgi:hypothetical protein